jgi:hypothetical protein
MAGGRMSGVPVLLGATRSPHALMMLVEDPPSQSIASERLLTACAESPSLTRVLLLFAHVLGREDRPHGSRQRGLRSSGTLRALVAHAQRPA